MHASKSDSSPVSPETLAPQYSPHAIEEKWYSRWETGGLFRADPASDAPGYSMVIPPPNVTGSLHIGHALNNTIQDILGRQQRMEGRDVLWVPGCDHAGIATQNVVERELAKQKINRHDLGREAFVEKVWAWKQEYGGRIMRQLRRLGSSLDWSRERFTMDPGLSEAVKEVFVRLYQEGLIYRGDYIINWCPRCQTALSDIEAEHQDVSGHFWFIRYPLVGGGEAVVATTRPETLLGDTALAVHPEDERYRAWIGKKAVLPLLNREIPVIGDSFVDRDFGTGVVKITPAHDPNDFLAGERHGLPRINVMNPDGSMSAEAGPYAGLDRFECRKRVVEDLAARGLLVKVEDHLHAVGHCYRCHTVVEPYLSRQWFVRMKPLAEPAVAAVKSGKIRFTPELWTKHYLEWMENIRDWCISRQIWWGHRIPAWYCERCGEVMVAKEAPAACPRCQETALRQDTDVLDTWFSSALWPFSTLGWPDSTPELKKYYPTSVLVTSWDIIFFWVARMIMMGLHFRGDVPFRQVCINSLVGDAEGKKMSKSKGNTVDPLDIMQHTGADGLRFAMAAIETQSRYVAFTPDRLESARNFMNKIWNASRFALMNLEGYQEPSVAPEPAFADQWIQSRLNQAVGKINAALPKYRFAEMAQVLYGFFWNEFCDWYLELLKPRLAGSAPEKATAQYFLLRVLENTLRLMHPFIPFITEEIWSHLPGDRGFLMKQTWPAALGETDRPDSWEQVEGEFGVLENTIQAVRIIRGEYNVPPGREISLLVKPQPDGLRFPEILGKHEGILRNLLKLEKLEMGPGLGKPKNSAVEVRLGMELIVPLEGLIDLEKAKIRLKKEQEHFSQLLVRVEAKLTDAAFLSRAPEAVLQAEREKQREYAFNLEKYAARLKELA